MKSADTARRVLGCQCHLEVGDSPCRVHGEQECPRCSHICHELLDDRCIHCLATERDQAMDRTRELEDALERLYAAQNGPPLELGRHKAAWEKAMDCAKAALARSP